MKMRVNNKILLWYNNKMKISLGGIVFMAKKGFEWANEFNAIEK